jgi:hypothetical protein
MITSDTFDLRDFSVVAQAILPVRGVFHSSTHPMATELSSTVWI